MTDGQTRLYIGIDLGTSGCRAIAIDENSDVIAECSLPLAAGKHDGNLHEQDPLDWWETVQRILTTLLNHIDAGLVRSIAVDGTSGTLMLTDKSGRPCSPALMYNDARCQQQAAAIAAVAPQDSGAHGATSGLAKLLYLQAGKHDMPPRHALHQADWISGKLCNRFDISDENNCLKLGYDSQQHCWPDWLDRLGVERSLLPHVVAAGTTIGTIDKGVAKGRGLSLSTRILAGTTDGVAAFLATGANQIGDAVTSLGSTLILKVLSERPVFAPEYGVYSHRLGDRWLVGGASNVGGTTLLQYFSYRQMEDMTGQLEPAVATGLNYYPLPGPGERFPVCDPDKQPVLTPRPGNDVQFFQAMLEGISTVEAEGYRLLAELGAPYPKSVRTVGGGARNPAWQEIRRQRLGIQMPQAQHQQAAYGTALLALRSDKPTGRP